LFGIISKTLSETKFALPGIVSIFLMCLVLWPIFRRQGTVALFQVGPIIFYLESVLYALAVGIRLVAMILAGIIFLNTTRIEDLEVGLTKLGLPYPLSFGISGVFRFIPTLMGDGQLILSAQEARGLDLRSGTILTKLRKAVPIMAPLLVTTFRRTGELAMAIESRGFRVEAKRNPIIKLRFTWKDWAIIIISLVLSAVFVILRILGYGAILPTAI
jgi:energy-coupling factor transport system permease protein